MEKRPKGGSGRACKVLLERAISVAERPAQKKSVYNKEEKDFYVKF